MTIEPPPNSATPEPTLFRLEPENFTTDGHLGLYTVSSKRKTPYTNTDTGRQPVSPSEFGLGHLLQPDGSPLGPDGVAAAWAWAALAGPEPDWIDDDALAHIPLTRHADLIRLEAGGADPRPWDTLVVAQADRIYGTTRDGSIPRPVALYRNNFSADQAQWIDSASDTALPAAAALPTEPNAHALTSARPLYLRTLRSILAAHIRAPERKALRPDGEPCTSRTHGILHSAPTEAFETVAIGREANYTEEAGVLNDPTYTEFPDSSRDRAQRRVLAVLRATARTGGYARLAHELELSESALRRYLKTGRARPATHARAHHQAATLAHTALAQAHPGQVVPQDPEALLYLATREGGPFEQMPPINTP